MAFNLYVEAKDVFAVRTKEWCQRLKEKKILDKMCAVHLVFHYTVSGMDEKMYATIRDRLLAPRSLYTWSDQEPMYTGTRFCLQSLGVQNEPFYADLRDALTFLCVKDDANICMEYIMTLETALDEDQRRQIRSFFLEDLSFSPYDDPQIARQINAHSGDSVINFRFMEQGGVSRLRQTLGLKMKSEEIARCQTYFRDEAKRDPTQLELQLIDTVRQVQRQTAPLYQPYSDVCCQDAFLYRSFCDYLEKTEEVRGRNFPVTLYDLLNLPRRYLHHHGVLPPLITFEDSGVNAIPILPNDPLKRGGRVGAFLQVHGSASFCGPRENAFAHGRRLISESLWDASAARGTPQAAMRIDLQPEPNTEREIFSMTATDGADGYQGYTAACGVPTLVNCEKYQNVYRNGGHMSAVAVISLLPAIFAQRKNVNTGDLFAVIWHGKSPSDAGVQTERRYESNPHTWRQLHHFFSDKSIGTMLKRCTTCHTGVLNAMMSLSGGGHLRLEQFPGEEQCGTWFQYLTEPLTDCILVIVSQLQERLLRRQVSSCGLEISFIGAVTEDNQWHMTYHDRTILRLSDKFLRFTEMHTMAEAKMEKVDTTAIERLQPRAPHASDFREIFLYHLSDPHFCSHDAIGSRIDFSAGAATLYATCGGSYDTANFSCGASHLTTMNQNLTFSEGIQRLSLHVNAEEKEENEVPVVLCAAGSVPSLSGISPYHSSYYAVLHTYARLVAAGAEPHNIYLYPMVDFAADRFGNIDTSRAMALALGYYQAQMDLQTVFLHTDYHAHTVENLKNESPAALTFAVSYLDRSQLLPSYFQKVGSRVYLIAPHYDLQTMLPQPESLQQTVAYLHHLIQNGNLHSACALGAGGIGAGVSYMCMAGHRGFNFQVQTNPNHLWEQRFGSFLVETDETLDAVLIGHTKDSQNLLWGNDSLPITDMIAAWSKHSMRSQKVIGVDQRKYIVENFHSVKSSYPRRRTAVQPVAKPLVYLPVFHSDRSEQSFAMQFEALGARAFVDDFGLRHLCVYDAAARMAEQLAHAQIMVITECNSSDRCLGGNGNMALLFGHPVVKEALQRFLYRQDGLILGVGGGFHTLLQAGLFFLTSNADFASSQMHVERLRQGLDMQHLYLAPNPGKHNCSRLVRVRGVSCSTPWTHCLQPETVYESIFSMAFGRLRIDATAMDVLRQYDMIGSQFVDENGNASMDSVFNPSCCDGAVESLLSADGRVMGKLCHFERMSSSLYPQITGNKDQPILRSAVTYFQ